MGFISFVFTLFAMNHAGNKPTIGVANILYNLMIVSGC